MLNRIRTFNVRDIYYKSPVFLQHVMTSAYGYKLKRERYGKIYQNALMSYVKGDFDKEQKLIQFMRHLKNNIDVYKNIEIDVENVMDSFLKLPFTFKEDLRNELEERSFKNGIIRVSTTSGTTGANLIVYDSEYDREERMAYLDYIKYMNGVMPFSKRASFTGQELTSIHHNNRMWRYNHTMRQMLYATRSMRPDNIEYIFQSLKRFRPVSLDGLPSSIHMVAQYILKNDINVDWGVKAIFSTAEILHPKVKKDLETAFNTIVIDQYSSAEGAPFIYSDAQGKYHIADETGLVEFYKVDECIYEMIVTSFINDATPIVRYKIKDQVKITSRSDYLNSFQHDCRIENIIGRGGDFLYASDGMKIRNIIVSWIPDGFESVISHYQFIQKSMREVVVNLVVEDSYTKKDELIIQNRTKKLFGDEVIVHFNYIDYIPKEKSGKTRMIINEVGDAVA